jgi:preprotein translocase SecE subunit
VSEASKALDNKAKRESVGEFYRNTRAELDKTSFPSSEDVKKTVVIVIINVIFFALFLYAVDYGWSQIVDGLKWLVSQIATF